MLRYMSMYYTFLRKQLHKPTTEIVCAKYMALSWETFLSYKYAPRGTIKSKWRQNQPRYTYMWAYHNMIIML